MAPGPAYGFSDKTPEERERIHALIGAAEEIFGNTLAPWKWLHSYAPAVGAGRRYIVDAAGTEQGLAEALAELERIRSTIIPEPLPNCLQPGGRKTRRRR